jgi:hypothetical protein
VKCPGDWPRGGTNGADLRSGRHLRRDRRHGAEQARRRQSDLARVRRASPRRRGRDAAARARIADAGQEALARPRRARRLGSWRRARRSRAGGRFTSAATEASSARQRLGGRRRCGGAARRAGSGSVSGRRATTSPARQPGARPPAGGWIDSAVRPPRAISQAVSEFEFHISPAASSSRPQTGVGTSAARSSTRCATCGSSVSRCGLSTASATSGMTPPYQRRTS